MCEERHAMGAARQPVCDEDACVIDADKPLHSRTIKDEEHCAMDSPPPPYNGDDDADQTARSRITRARVFLAMGLAFEVSATFWAFQQAVSAGALNGDVNCGYDGRIERLYSSSLTVDNCNGPIDRDAFYKYSGNLTYSPNPWEEYDGCDDLTDAPNVQGGFVEGCTCSLDYADLSTQQSCSWVALSHTSDGICYAEPVSSNSSGGDIDWGLPYYWYVACWPTNPTGSKALTITALIVALSSQLLEAFVGFKYWRYTETQTAPTLAASLFEALGVIVVSSVLFSLPGFYLATEYVHRRLPVLFWLAWTIIAIVVVGALAEISAEYSDRAAGRFPYLGAVGNGLIWLGAALLEIAVTVYLLWTGEKMRNVSDLVGECVSLFALELLDLVAMWIARGLWARAKLLRSR